MDREEVKAFFRWLEGASEAELWEAHADNLQRLDKLRGTDFEGDALFRLHHIEDQLLALVSVRTDPLASRMRDVWDMYSRRFTDRRVRTATMAYYDALAARIVRGES
jgi:hypothetical protein